MAKTNNNSKTAPKSAPAETASKKPSAKEDLSGFLNPLKRLRGLKKRGS